MYKSFIPQPEILGLLRAYPQLGLLDNGWTSLLLVWWSSLPVLPFLPLLSHTLIRSQSIRSTLSLLKLPKPCVQMNSFKLVILMFHYSDRKVNDASLLESLRESQTLFLNSQRYLIFSSPFILALQALRWLCFLICLFLERWSGWLIHTIQEQLSILIKVILLTGLFNM